MNQLDGEGRTALHIAVRLGFYVLRGGNVTCS